MPPKGKGEKGKVEKGGSKGAGKGKDAGGKGAGKSKDGGKSSEGKASAKGKSKDGGKSGEGKASGKGKSQETQEEKVYSTDGRPYTAALAELYKNSAAAPRDFDPKAVQLLDALYNAGGTEKIEAAVVDLTKKLEGVERAKVLNWRNYLFAHLRAFDKEVYTAMKEERGRPERSRNKKVVPIVMTALKATAAEFIPGQFWAGAAAALPKTEATPSGTVFQVECRTEAGESVLVLGSAQGLGSWDMKEAKPLKLEGTTWKSEPLDIGFGEVEYKFIVKKGDDVRWEAIEPNRKLKGGAVPPVVKFGES